MSAPGVSFGGALRARNLADAGFARSTPKPFTMFLVSAAAMMAGFWIDCRDIGPQILAYLCIRSPSPWVMLHLCKAFMPWTILLMVLGSTCASFFTGPYALGSERRSPQKLSAAIGLNLSSSVAMLTGMMVGENLGFKVVSLTPLSWDATMMAVTMTAGMAAGMAVSAAVMPLTAYTRYATAIQSRRASKRNLFGLPKHLTVLSSNKAAGEKWPI